MFFRTFFLLIFAHLSFIFNLFCWGKIELKELKSAWLDGKVLFFPHSPRVQLGGDVFVVFCTRLCGWAYFLGLLLVVWYPPSFLTHCDPLVTR